MCLSEESSLLAFLSVDGLLSSSDAHASETEALRSSHETIQTSQAGDHANELSNVRLDLMGETIATSPRTSLPARG